jgi:cell division protein FtsL
MAARSSPLLTAACAAALLACSLALVASQYRARELFAELEVSQQEAKTLDADGSRLRSELGRVAQPATVEAVARRLGMRAIDPERIVLLPPRSPSAVAAAAPATTPVSAVRGTP